MAITSVGVPGAARGVAVDSWVHLTRMEKRDYQLTIAFSDELRQFIEQRARSEDQTKAAVVRRCVAQAARLEHQEAAA